MERHMIELLSWFNTFCKAMSGSSNQDPQTSQLSKEVLISVLLSGVYDDGSTLSVLRGHQHLIELICILATNEDRWRKHIKLPSISQIFFTEVHGGVHSELEQASELIFPPPSGVKINMMPFIMGQSFEDCKLPNNLKGYWPFIELCLSADIYRKDDDHLFRRAQNEINKVGYLTIDEELVDIGRSQRRPGLHTDNPGKVKVNNKRLEKSEGQGWCEHYHESSSKYICHHWGFGGCHLITYPMQWDSFKGALEMIRFIEGGIYMASNVDSSCEVMNCQIVEDENGDEVIGKFGSVEHLRGILPPATKLKANTMYWITDRTPHESLPLQQTTHRQFFRLVTSKVSLWYEDHSTKNPFGVVPDPSMTKILKGNKFSDEGVWLVETSEKPKGMKGLLSNLCGSR